VTPRVVLTIAGSDSSGGAGIEADLRTFAALGVLGAVALTAVTAQNTTAVTAVLPVEPEMVAAQVRAVTDDLVVAAVKTGMLARPATVAAVAELASRGLLPNLVVDPVLVSSTGHPLMESGGIDAYRELLLPHAAVATPNLREAALLCDVGVEELSTVDQMAAAGRAICGLGARWVLVKGGHFMEGAATAARAPDVLVSNGYVGLLDAVRIETGNDHGTGCSLASAVAVGLAEGLAPEGAVRRAKAFVHRALEGAASWHVGGGHGPIDHFGWGPGA
jgi:hydroxymethylpyrimidine/phosphomethylpyrimidine kinase